MIEASPFYADYLYRLATLYGHKRYKNKSRKKTILFSSYSIDYDERIYFLRLP